MDKEVGYFHYPSFLLQALSVTILNGYHGNYSARLNQSHSKTVHKKKVVLYQLISVSILEIAILLAYVLRLIYSFVYSFSDKGMDADSFAFIGISLTLLILSLDIIRNVLKYWPTKNTPLEEQPS
jgi:hypothetical protein